jgi:hypothetical protein
MQPEIRICSNVSRKGALGLLVVLFVLGTLEIRRPAKVALTLVDVVVKKQESHGMTSSIQTINPGRHEPVSEALTWSPQSHNFAEQNSYPIGDDYLFWSGHNKICDLINNITGVSKLGLDSPPRYLDEGLQPPLVNLTMNCSLMLANTGNWVTALYHLRLAAAAGRVDFLFQCSEEMDTAESSVLPWLSGYFPTTRDTINSNEWPYDLGWPEGDLVCSTKYLKLPLQHLAHEMQKDMRSMAVVILGSRSFNTSGLENRIDQLRGWIQRHHPAGSVYPREGVLVDDAAVHFRCGDVFGGTQKNDYGLIQFKEFKGLIPRETTKSIGIFTQSFNESRVREADRQFVEKCKKVVDILVDYLQKSYPNVTISIRNTEEDTIPVTYARMIMASHTITTMSTFGIFPAIGSFGEGHFKSSGRQNRFAHHIPEVLPNFHMMAQGNMLSSPEIRKSRWEDVIKFLSEE